MNYIYKKLDRLNVLGRVSTVTCDGASNMTKAFDTFEAVDRLWCLGHRLHLIVTNALGFWLKDKNKEINDAIDDTTTINPTDDVGDLDTKEIFNDEEDALAANDSDEETEMEDAQTDINGYGPIDDGWGDDVITEDNYSLQSRTSKVSQILTPFDLATKLLSDRQYPTIGLCLFAIHHLKLFLDDTEGDTELEQQLKRSFLDKMAKYIDDEKEQMRMLR
ncbi:unnamed protein product, partial [Adineta ricciae]